MVEREHPYVSPENNSTAVADGTLNEFLYRGSRWHKDRYNLGTEPFSLARLSNSSDDDTIYLGLMHHPLSGVHLGQIASEIAPFPQGYQAMLADFTEMRASHRHALKGEKGSYLDGVHRGDPRIGETFAQFYSDNFNRWLGALQNNEFSDIYGRLPHLLFTYDAEAYGERMASQWDKAMKEGHFGDFHFAIQSAVHSVRSDAFIDFLKDNNSFYTGLRRDLDPNDIDRLWRRFDHFDFNKQLGFTQEYISTLSPEDLKRIIFEYMVTDQHKTIVDLKDRTIISKEDSDIMYDFVDEDKVAIIDNRGSNITVQANVNESGSFDWQVTSHDLKEPEGRHLLPLLAWEKDTQGSRRFLTQAEAQQALRSVGLGSFRHSADIVAGKVVLDIYNDASFHWDEKIPLTREDGSKTIKQHIRAAQVPVWVGMPENERGLSHPYHPLRRLEAAIQ